MKETENTSSWRPAEASKEAGKLLRVSLDHLRAHPANPNQMDEDELTKLAENITREEDYEPLVVRPNPDEDGTYQVLNGRQRWTVLEGLGHTHATCYVWPCDDETALVLLATLNRLRGTDQPAKRAELLRDLSELMPIDDLAALLPEDAAAIQQNLDLLESDLDTLLEAFKQPHSPHDALRAVTFVVSVEEELVIEEAVAGVVGKLEGKNRRGRALAEIAREYLACQERAER